MSENPEESFNDPNKSNKKDHTITTNKKKKEEGEKKILPDTTKNIEWKVGFQADCKTIISISVTHRIGDVISAFTAFISRLELTISSISVFFPPFCPSVLRVSL